jgi:hypothetical protein
MSLTLGRIYERHVREKREGTVRRGGVLLVALAVSACSAGEAPVPARPPSASAVAARPGFANGAACERSSDPSLRAPAGCVTSLSAGDETMVVYAVLGRDRFPEEWRIRLQTPGGRVERRLPFGTVTAYPRVAAVSDLNRDGDPDWWWVKTLDYASHGALWGGLQVFVGDGASLEPIVHEGEPLVVNFGGISRLGEGARCEPGGLALLRVEAKDRQNTNWSMSRRVFSVEGTQATFEERLENVLEIESYSDPRLHRNYRVDCFGAVFTPAGEVRD